MSFMKRRGQPKGSILRRTLRDERQAETAKLARSERRRLAVELADFCRKLAVQGRSRLGAEYERCLKFTP
jgi:hypothetical protein